MAKKINMLPIENEYDLVARLAMSLQPEFNTDVFVKEFTAGYGIADLVFARSFYNKENVLNRRPISNYFALSLYLSLPDNTQQTLSELNRLIGVSSTTTRQIVKELVRDNYLSVTDAGLFQKIGYIDSPVKNLVAIEVKLRDWKQGILQARRYKSFTDECYLAILARYDKNIDYSYLEKFDVGLILFDEDTGKIELKRRPITSDVFSIYKDETNLFAKEIFLASI